MFINYEAIKKNVHKFWTFFLDLIFPLECLGCGAEGAWLCEECFKKIKLKSRQYCLHCKKENDFGQFCPNCQANYSLDGVWIAALYEDELVARLIKSLKYYFVSSLARELGRLLVVFVEQSLNQGRILRSSLATGLRWRELARAKRLPAILLNFKDSLVVPVPLAKKRLRWRGFNQAEILGRALGQHFGLTLNCQLFRIKHNKPQAKLHEAQRLANVKDCFAWRGENLAGRNVLLIDDVVTTGATLNECAKVLKQNGGGEVWALVVAKG
jgi:ComF family protein